MQFMVRFVGHIIEEKRPSGFPKEVFTDITVNTQSRDGLKESVNDFLVLLIKQCGMVVEKPEAIARRQATGDGLKPDFKDLDNKIFVPYHMMSYLETISKLVSAKVETGEEEGEEVTPILLQ